MKKVWIWILALIDITPVLKNEGKNPFILDSKEPTENLKDFLMQENRYASLTLAFPEQADVLLNKAVSDAKERMDAYNRLAKD